MWLVRRKYKIVRVMLWVLLLSWLMLGVSMYQTGKVDWQSAKLYSERGMAVSLDEEGKEFTAEKDGQTFTFFCGKHYPFCQALSRYENRHNVAANPQQRLLADLKYLGVSEGNVLLSASFTDELTQERVEQVYPKALVDGQVELLEKRAAGWANVFLYLRHILFTVFFLLLFIRLYIAVFERKILRRVEKEQD